METDSLIQKDEDQPTYPCTLQTLASEVGGCPFIKPAGKCMDF